MEESEKGQALESEAELQDQPADDESESVASETTACGLVVSEDEGEEWQDY